MNNQEKQCFHCGNVPTVINAGFDFSKIKEYAQKGEAEYFWTCEKCYNENYYKESIPYEVAKKFVNWSF